MTAIGINPAGADTPQVNCDPVQDQIRLNTPSSTLFELLTAISGECGIVFKADPSLDRELHLTLDPQPLEPALKSMLHGISYLFVYAQRRTHTGSRRIMEVHLLPQGNASMLMREFPVTREQKNGDAQRPREPERTGERGRSPRGEQRWRQKEAERAMR